MPMRTRKFSTRFGIAAGESLLNVGGGANRGHDAVAGVFHFAAGMQSESPPD
jgi:hypothetical protein